MDGRRQRVGGARSFALEAEAAQVAVNEFKHAKMGRVRSLQDAREDPDWQQEVLDMRAAGYGQTAATEPLLEAAAMVGNPHQACCMCQGMPVRQLYDECIILQQQGPPADHTPSSMSAGSHLLQVMKGAVRRQQTGRGDRAQPSMHIVGPDCQLLRSAGPASAAPSSPAPPTRAVDVKAWLWTLPSCQFQASVPCHRHLLQQALSTVP